MKDRKKVNFQIGQEFYCLERTKAGIKINKIIVDRIGRKYIYFNNKNRYEFGSDWIQYYWGINEWRADVRISYLFDTLIEAEEEVRRLEIIDKITDKWQVREFLQSLSKDLVHRINDELDSKSLAPHQYHVDRP